MNIRQWLAGKRIAVLYGGRSAERPISLVTGNAVLSACKELRLRAIGIDVDKQVAARLRDKKIDFAFIALHGPLGEDGCIQGMLEVMNIPYSGEGVLANALAMDKGYSKKMFEAAKVPTPRWWVIEKESPFPTGRICQRLPVIVKPSTQGSAIGVALVRKREELAPALRKAFQFDRRVIIEQYIEGTEITVGIIGETVLPVIEIVPLGAFYDFKSKYKKGQSKHIIPPRLPQRSIQKAKRTAERAFAAIGCSVLGRVDLIIDKAGNPWVLEINTIPGLTPTSLLPDAAKAAGIGFNELVLRIMHDSLHARSRAGS